MISSRLARRPLLRTALLRTTALVAAAAPIAAHAQELPTGGQVVAGQASIATAGQTMTVTTSTQRTVIDWTSFSVGTDHRLTIAQPDANSINVNRVTGVDPSKIFGTISSNGKVVIANPNGIWFGPSARVDVAGVVASAGRISDASVADFMAGRSLTIGAGNADASVVNDGVITARQGGFAALVAPGVRNSGTITARLGQVTLAAGKTTTVDFYGDGLINLAVAGQTEASPFASAVENKGNIYAEGGHVLLSANVAQGVLDTVINMSGAIEAKGVSTAGGVVELLAGTESVSVSGKVDVSGQGSQDGGRIAIQAGAAGSTDGGVLDLSGTLDASAQGGKGGTIAAGARFASVSGSVHADGATGGSVAIAATGVTQSGAITADATSGAAGGVAISGRLNVTQTQSARTSASSASGKGGSVAVTAEDGRVFSSGTLKATGVDGGAVDVLARDVTLAAAKLDASGAANGGAIRVGGDLHGEGTATAKTTLVNGATTLNASAGATGNGGKVVVWSDEKTDYQGSASARGGSIAGNGGMIEVSSKGTLTFSGDGDAGATAGKAGTLLLDPKNIVIAETTGGLATFELLDPNAGQGYGFGTLTAQLSNGTIVVTKPNDTVGGAANAGSVNFYDPQTGALISTFQGGHAGDQIGSGSGGDGLWGSTGLLFLDQTGGYDYNTGMPLYDGSKPFLILSPNWNSARGAVTWVGADGTASGVVTSSNSLVGGTAGDLIGAMDSPTNTQIDILTTGNFLVRSPNWSNNRGALTFVNGTTGLTGMVSASNSLVGSTSTAMNGNGRKGDYLGSGGIVKLANGNFVVLSPYWNKMGGAVSFGSGTTGFASLGALSDLNSLVGNGGTTYSATNQSSGTTLYSFYGGDNVGATSSNIVELTNGDYIVVTSNWGHGRGSVTLASGTTGLTGTISASNSLVGTTSGIGDTSDGTNTYYLDYFGNRSWYGGDNVGSYGITQLSNGGFVVRSPNWSMNRGALTFYANGTTALSGAVSASTSLTGTYAGSASGYDGFHRQFVGGGDQVGSNVAALTNGNYVAATSNWNSSRGAVTVLDGATGQAVTGSSGSSGETISASNSLVGSTGGDNVGNVVVKLEGTSDFVTSAYAWDSGKGAVTRISGTTGLVGAVSASNSLVGTTSYETSNLGGDNVGGSVVALSSGAFAILSPNWNKTRGAVTFVTAGASITGNISSSNSLVGGTGAEGNAVYCASCSNGSPAIFGGDLIGSGGITQLANGNFLIKSPEWTQRRGAVTYVNGTTGAMVDGTGSLTGTLSAANSLVGTQSASRYVSARYSSLYNTNYIGVRYYVGGDQVGGMGTPVVELANGNFLLFASGWHNNTGAVTFGTADGKLGNGSVFAGTISSSNSLVGSTAGTLYTPSNTANEDYRLDYYNGDRIGSDGYKQLSNGNVLLFSPNWSQTRGATTLISGTTGLSGTVGSANSLVGTTAGDTVGSGGTYYSFEQPNGNLLLINSAWNGYSGALTEVSSTGLLSGQIDATNSLIGNAGDALGYGGFGIVQLANGAFFLNSPSANYGQGAISYSDGTTPLIGTLNELNSFYGDPTAYSGYAYGVKLNAPGSLLMNFTYEGSGRVVLGFTDPTGWTYARAQQQTLTIAPSLIAKALNGGTSLVLQASNDITINDAITTNAGSTANLTLTAGRSIIGHNDIYLGNGALTLLANDSVANGVVDAYRDPGAAGIAFDAGTTLSAGTVDIILATSTDKTNNATGDIALGNIDAGTVSARNLGTGALTLGGAINATDSGTSILLSTLGNFVNTAGANALLPGAGRFLVYSADPRNNSKGGLASDGHYFGTTLTANPPSSFAAGADLFLYSVVPTLTVTASGNVGYGDALSSLPLSITGFIDGDTQASALTGSVNLGTSYVAGNAVGGHYAVTVGAGTLASSVGYQLNFVNGSVTVAPKVLSLALTGTSSKEYDRTTAAALAAGNYQLTGLYGSDSITISKTSGSFASASAGTNLGVSTTLASGDFVAGGSTLLSNYVLPTGFLSANIGTITPKALGLSGVSATGRVYDGTTAIALSGGTLAGIIAGDTVNLVAGSGSVASKDVGVAKAVTATGYGLSGTSAGNYTLAAQPTGLSATITAKALTLSGVTAAGRDYDGTTAIALSGGTLSGVIGSDAVSLVTGSGSVATKDVGTNKAVTVSGYGLSGTGAGNYSIAAQPIGLTATITAKALTLSGVTASDRDYDGTTAIALSGGTLAGLVDGDAVSLVTGTGSVASKNIGTNKVVTATGFGISGADAGNYSFSGQPTGLTASIAAKALTLTGLVATDRVYDGTMAVALTGGMLTGVIGSDMVGFTSGTGLFADKNVGTGKAVSLSGFGLNGADAGNYVLNGQPAGLTASVAAKTLTLSGVTATGRAYDGTTDVALTGGTLSGIVGSDAISLVSGTGSIASKTVGTNKAVTATGFGLGGADAGNYALAGQPTGLSTTITARALTLTGVTATDRAYDGTTSVALTGGTLSGLVGGDAVALIGGSGSIASKNAGLDKAVTVTGFGLTGTDAGNYSLVGQPGGLTVDIAAKLLTLSGITATDRAYDGTTTVALSGGTLAGIVGSDTVGFTTGTGALADKNVGIAKAVSLSGFGLNGADAGNYALSSQPAGLTATISAKTLTLSGVTAMDRSYDGTTAVALTNGTLSGIVGSDAISLVSGTGSIADKTVGTNKAVTVSGFGIGGADAGNYALAGQPNGLTTTITAKAVTLTGVTAQGRGYDGTTAVALSGGTISGLIASDAVSLVSGTGSVADKNIGAAKAVTVTGFGLSGADAANYSFGGQPIGLTVAIAPRAVTLSGFTAIDRDYDGTTSVALTGGSLTGLVANDTVSFVSGSGSVTDKNVGTSKAVTVSGFGLTGADAANYAFQGAPANLSVSIAPKAVTLSGVTAVGRAYDGTTSVALSGGTLSGLVATDAVSLISGSGTIADKNAGNAKGVNVSGFGLSGPDAGNYALAGQPAGLTVTIDPATLAVSLVPSTISKTYDGTAGATLGQSSYMLSGLIGSETISIVKTGGSFASAGAGTGLGVSVTLGLPDYIAGADTSLANYALPTGSFTGQAGTILPAALLVRADDKGKVAGDPLPGLSVSYTGFKGTDTAGSIGFSPAISTSATAQSPAGAYAIQVSGGQLANYTVTYEPGVLTVTPQPVQIPLEALIVNQPVAPIVASAAVGGGSAQPEAAIVVGAATSFVPVPPPVAVPTAPATGVGTATAGIGSYDAGAQSANSYANSYLSSIKLESQQ